MDKNFECSYQCHTKCRDAKVAKIVRCFIIWKMAGIEIIFQFIKQALTAAPIEVHLYKVENEQKSLINSISQPVDQPITNEKINTGAMLRFLGEMVWFPAAACNNYIQWEEMDSLYATAQ